MSVGETDTRFQRVCETVVQEMNRLPIPGVAVGVLYGDRQDIAGFGVTSVENPLEVTQDTLFQVGSITKTYVATLVMRLVEAGKVDLDVPLQTYLPDLQLNDAEATANATLRHCLTHTGGWEGDYFDDFGRGEDALSKMVFKMRELPQHTPLGKLWSYNNTGFYLAGRVIEVVTGKTFEAAMQELVFDPLGLKNSFFFAEDVISRRFVVGHQTGEDGKPHVARPWALARTAHAAGGIVCSIPDLFRYARFHIGDGMTEDGTRLLTRASLDAMQTPLHPSTDPQWVGLGWYLRDIGTTRVFGHGGGTKGQVTQLLIAPAQHMALAILTNSESGDTLINPVLKSILHEYLNVAQATPEHVEMSAAQLEPYAARYEASEDTATLVQRNGELVLQVTYKGGFPTPTTPPPPVQPPPVHVTFYGEDKIVALEEPFQDAHGQFLRGADGEIEWLRLFGRVHKRA